MSNVAESRQKQWPGSENLRPWKPGQSGNPGGKPVAARNRIQGDFVKRLADDFERYGIYAIARTRRHRPWEYLKVVASLMPKEFKVQKDLDELTDEQLAAAVLAVGTILASKDFRAGAIETEVAEPLKELPAISEAT